MLRKKCIPERGRRETLLRRLTLEFCEGRTKVSKRESERERGLLQHVSTDIS